MPSDLANRIGILVQLIVTVSAALLVAFWLALTIWTFRDISARTRDPIAILLSTLLALLFGPIGVLLYLLLRPKETLAERYDRALEEEALLRDVEELNLCPGCRRPIKEDWQVCPYCHTPLRRPCPHCGRLVDLNWDICPYCTADLTVAETVEVVYEAPVSEPQPAEATPEAPAESPVEVAVAETRTEE